MLEKSDDNDDKNDDNEDNDHNDDKNEGGSENIDYMVNFFSKNHKGGKYYILYSWHTVSLIKQQVKEQNLTNSK